jgi:hypothetical protein
MDLEFRWRRREVPSPFSVSLRAAESLHLEPAVLEYRYSLGHDLRGRRLWTDWKPVEVAHESASE